MSDTEVTEPIAEPAIEAAPVTDSEEASGAADVSSEPAPETEPEPETFSREYVEKLRRENAEARVRAKVADVANAHLLTAYASADGRLQNVADLALSPDLIGDDGLVDRDRVADSIGQMVAERPYLQARKAPSLPMGARPEASPEVGWVDILRGGVQ